MKLLKTISIAALLLSLTSCQVGLVGAGVAVKEAYDIISDINQVVSDVKPVCQLNLPLLELINNQPTISTPVGIIQNAQDDLHIINTYVLAFCQGVTSSNTSVVPLDENSKTWLTKNLSEIQALSTVIGAHMHFSIVHGN